MSLHSEWIRYGGEGRYSGYIARLNESKEKMPAVIVLQEIWGVDEHIQDVTRRFAQAGYVAFAPDLFAVNGERLGELTADRMEETKRFLNMASPAVWADEKIRNDELSRLSGDLRERISGTLGRIFNLAGMFPSFHEQLIATSAFLRDTYSYSQGKGVASVGFCLGGALSGQLAVRDPDLKGAVVFYGNPPQEDAIAAIGCPVLGFYGETDKRITDGIPAFAEAMNKAGKDFSYRIYPGAPHAFFNDTRPSYHVDAARDAFVTALDFLQRQLV
jgi:carboxymethylenebutenolidase